jgi:RNA polymerase sigma-70 factor (ECF subfamily)
MGAVAMEQRVTNSAVDFETAFFEYYKRIVGVLYRIVGDRAQAEELASDAFLKLYQHAPPGQFENLGGWLYRTATRLGLDSLRAASRRRRYEEEAGRDLVEKAAVPDPLGDVLRAERCRKVRAALALLKPAQAQVLTLRSSGLSYQEVAEALGVKTNAVGRLLARAEEAFQKAYRRIEMSGPPRPAAYAREES